MLEIEFNPNTPEIRANPYPFYERFRQSTPIFFSRLWDAWFLMGYKECKNLLRDHRLGQAFGENGPLLELVDNLIISHKNHSRIRRVSHKLLFSRTAEPLPHQIQWLAQQLFDKVQAKGEMDLIADVAYPLAMRTMAKILCVPVTDQKELCIIGYNLRETLGLYEDPEVLAKGVKATADLATYVQDIIKAYRTRGEENLAHIITTLMADDNDPVSDEVLYDVCLSLIMTGGISVSDFAGVMGNGILALLRNPTQFAKLKANPNLIKSAIQELLRYEPSVQMTDRTALEDIEVGGYLIKKGQRVNFIIGSANHDPEKFKNPDEVDITRQPNQHLSFGAGSHTCLGAALSNLEGEIIFNTLLKRTPNLRLMTENLIYHDTFLYRGLMELPLAF